MNKKALVFHCPKCPNEEKTKIRSVYHAMKIHGARYSSTFIIKLGFSFDPNTKELKKEMLEMISNS